MSRTLSSEQMELLGIIVARDTKRTITTTNDLIAATGRDQPNVKRSLDGLERRGAVIRAGTQGKTAVWTCSESLAMWHRKPVMTCVQGDNADLMEQISRVYLTPGQTIADVTYGLGVFWRKINESQYRILKSDLAPLIPEQGYSDILAADFCALPYKSDEVDVVVIDPPYMHGGATIKESINHCYLNQNGSAKDVLAMYEGGIREAHRVLRDQGLIMVKVGDEIESGKVQFTHIALHHLLEEVGFQVVQHFVLMRKSIPAMRVTYQLHARTNHSYLLIARKRKAGSPQFTMKNRRFYANGRSANGHKETAIA